MALMILICGACCAYCGLLFGLILGVVAVLVQIVVTGFTLPPCWWVGTAPNAPAFFSGGLGYLFVGILLALSLNKLCKDSL